MFCVAVSRGRWLVDGLGFTLVRHFSIADCLILVSSKGKQGNSTGSDDIHCDLHSDVDWQSNEVDAECDKSVENEQQIFK